MAGITPVAVCFDPIVLKQGDISPRQPPLEFGPLAMSTNTQAPPTKSRGGESPGRGGQSPSRGGEVLGKPREKSKWWKPSGDTKQASIPLTSLSPRSQRILRGSDKEAKTPRAPQRKTQKIAKFPYQSLTPQEAARISQGFYMTGGLTVPPAGSSAVQVSKTDSQHGKLRQLISTLGVRSVLHGDDLMALLVATVKRRVEREQTDALRRASLPGVEDASSGDDSNNNDEHENERPGGGSFVQRALQFKRVESTTPSHGGRTPSNQQGLQQQSPLPRKVTIAALGSIATTARTSFNRQSSSLNRQPSGFSSSLKQQPAPPPLSGFKSSGGLTASRFGRTHSGIQPAAGASQRRGSLGLVRSSKNDNMILVEDVLLVCDQLKLMHRAIVMDKDKDILEAFIASGGNPDKTGFVDANLLRRKFANFNLTLDVDTLLDQIDTDGSGEVDFDEFKVLLSSLGGGSGGGGAVANEPRVNNDDNLTTSPSGATNRSGVWTQLGELGTENTLTQQQTQAEIALTQHQRVVAVEPASAFVLLGGDPENPNSTLRLIDILNNLDKLVQDDEEVDWIWRRRIHLAAAQTESNGLFTYNEFEELIVMEVDNDMAEANEDYDEGINKFLEVKVAAASTEKPEQLRQHAVLHKIMATLSGGPSASPAARRGTTFGRMTSRSFWRRDDLDGEGDILQSKLEGLWDRYRKSHVDLELGDLTLPGVDGAPSEDSDSDSETGGNSFNKRQKKKKEISSVLSSPVTSPLITGRCMMPRELAYLLTLCESLLISEYNVAMGRFPREHLGPLTPRSDRGMMSNSKSPLQGPRSGASFGIAGIRDRMWKAIGVAIEWLRTHRKCTFCNELQRRREEKRRRLAASEEEKKGPKVEKRKPVFPPLDSLRIGPRGKKEATREVQQRQLVVFDERGDPLIVHGRSTDKEKKGPHPPKYLKKVTPKVLAYDHVDRRMELLFKKVQNGELDKPRKRPPPQVTKPGTKPPPVSPGRSHKTVGMAESRQNEKVPGEGGKTGVKTSQNKPCKKANAAIKDLEKKERETRTTAVEPLEARGRINLQDQQLRHYEDAKQRQQKRESTESKGEETQREGEHGERRQEKRDAKELEEDESGQRQDVAMEQEREREATQLEKECGQNPTILSVNSKSHSKHQEQDAAFPRDGNHRSDLVAKELNARDVHQAQETAERDEVSKAFRSSTKPMADDFAKRRSQLLDDEAKQRHTVLESEEESFAKTSKDLDVVAEKVCEAAKQNVLGGCLRCGKPVLSSDDHFVVGENGEHILHGGECLAAFQAEDDSSSSEGSTMSDFSVDSQ